MIKKLGIFSLGSIGCRHLKVARDFRSDINIVAIRSGFGKDTKEEKFADSIFHSFEDAINYGIECAIIASPTVFHVQQAINLMENGIHVLIEKPLSNSLENINQLVKIEKK